VQRRGGTAELAVLRDRHEALESRQHATDHRSLL
jgi:hypothetical protein